MITWNDNTDHGTVENIESLATELSYDERTALQVDGEAYWWQRNADGSKEVVAANNYQEWLSAWQAAS